MRPRPRPSLLLFLLGHVPAVVLVLILLVPQHSRFPHSGKVMTQMGKLAAAEIVTEETLVQFLGPITEKGSANNYPWYKWKCVQAEGCDVVEQEWLITFTLSPGGEKELYVVSQRHLLFGWEWTKAMYQEQFNSKLFGLDTQPRRLGVGIMMGYPHKR